MEMETMINTNHGPNVRRWREWRGMKQDVLAKMIGISQATLSLYENKDKLDKEILEKIAKALDIPVEAITELGKETQINIFSGPCSDNANGNGNINNYVFNPIEKVVELFEQKEALYERMLTEKQSVMDLLQEIVKDNM